MLALGESDEDACELWTHNAGWVALSSPEYARAENGCGIIQVASWVQVHRVDVPRICWHDTA
jgi:hypothetical protein